MKLNISIYDLKNFIKRIYIIESKKNIEKSDTSIFYYFLDVHKNNIKYWCNVIDKTSNNYLDKHTDIKCWWDRHKFKTSPLGCPLEYSKNIFFTEGIFCSFPCIYAYIHSMKDIEYTDSIILLNLMIKLYFNKNIQIKEAPSWKLLKEYGGHLSIEEFRQSFSNINFYECINKNIPMLDVSTIFIENKQLNI